MELGTRIVKKKGALRLSQFAFGGPQFSRFEMVTAYKMLELKRNLSLAAYLSDIKTYLQTKREIYKLAQLFESADRSGL